MKVVGRVVVRHVKFITALVAGRIFIGHFSQSMKWLMNVSDVMNKKS